MTRTVAAGIEIRAEPGGRQGEILSAEALAFLADLNRRFNRQRLELLKRRTERQKLLDAGNRQFSPRDKIRSRRRLEGRPDPGGPSRSPGRDHRPCRPQDDRQRVELGRHGFHGDFEDATSPMFANMIEGQANLKDRWAGKIDFTDPATGKVYALKSNPAVLMVRPRGWHLPGAACGDRQRGHVRLAVRFRPVRLPLRQSERPRAPRPPFTCRSWRAASRRGCGTRSSRMRSARSAWNRAHSRRRC